ncbi:MAG: FAD-dependent oxidoreductase [Deltaproteobacteria bacterium]|nr:FAD-dependent oxidoreductase [Deltaproteobacteria bacterium]
MSNYKVRLRNLPSFREEVTCMMGCPIRTDCGMYVQSVPKRAYEEGYLIARQPNPFASVCGRVCAAPCEDTCRRGKVNIGEPISIRSLKKFLCEKYGVESRQPDTQNKLFEGRVTESHGWEWHASSLMAYARKETKVAVVGSGVGGLTCAHDLALRGYRVTVFESSDTAGGMVRFGIPRYRLPNYVLEKEIQKIADMGVDIRYHTPLTDKFGIKELRDQGYEAIFIAVGAQKGRDLSIEGTGLDGVIRAIEYLVAGNKGLKYKLGKKVVVVGGGLVALDAARDALRTLLETTQREAAPSQAEEELGEQRIFETLDVARAALREGAIEVDVVSLESMDQMPAARSIQGKAELVETKDEGITFFPSWGPKRIVGEGGRVKAVEFKKVLSVFDEKRMFNPKFDESVTKVFEADSVIMAIGQAIDLSFIRKEDGIEITPRGTIKIDPVTLATTAPGIFAGGDSAFGPRNLIDAEADGKKAAAAMDEYLSKKKIQVGYRVSVEVLPTDQYRMPENYDLYRRKTPALLEPDKRIGLQEVEQSFSEEEAIIQGTRCLQCHTSPVYNADLCILCGRCSDICPEDCFSFVPIQEVDLSAEDKETIYNNLGYRNDEPVTVLLKDDEKCIRCGLCSIICPTGAMMMERIIVKEELSNAGQR